MNAPDLLCNDRAAWLEARRTCITATDIAAIVGLNHWSSPLSVWRDKMGLSPEKDVTDAMRLGTDLEPFIGAMFARDKGVEITKADFTLNEKEPIFGATPDFLIGDDALLECKYAGVNAAKAFGEEYTDLVPDHYLCQVQWQLGVTGRKMGYLAVFAPSIAPRVQIYEIPRNEEFITRLQFAARKFWHEHVVKEIAPEITGSKADTDAINATPADPSEDWIRADDKLEEVIEKLKGTTEKSKELYKEKCRLENIIKDFMGKETVLVSDQGRFTWKEQDRKSLKLESLPADLGKQCLPYLSTSTSRVLRTPFRTEG